MVVCFIGRTSAAFNLNYRWMVFFDDGWFVLREWNGSVKRYYSQDIRGVFLISQWSYVGCVDLELLGEPDFYRPQAGGRDAEDGNAPRLLFSYHGDL